jgi:hypothetical protein
MTGDGGTGMDCMKPHPSRWISDTYNFYEEPLDWSAIRELLRSYVLTVHDTAVPTEMLQEARLGITGNMS